MKINCPRCKGKGYLITPVKEYISTDIQKIPEKYQSKVIRCIREANRLLSDNSFLAHIEKHGVFDYSRDGVDGVDGEELVEIIQDFTGKAKLAGYRPWSKRVLARVHSRTPSLIEISTKRLDRPYKDIVGTIVHEFIHVLDNFHRFYFGHGDNSSKGKGNSAAYKVGDEAKKFAFTE